MTPLGHEEVVDVELINLTSQGGCMERTNRMIEERLSRLERFEKARYHQRKVRNERIWFSILMIAALITAVGIGRLI